MSAYLACEENFAQRWASAIHVTGLRNLLLLAQPKKAESLNRWHPDAPLVSDNLRDIGY
jgi:hypothetical protein